MEKKTFSLVYIFVYFIHFVVDPCMWSRLSQFVSAAIQANFVNLPISLVLVPCHQGQF